MPAAGVTVGGTSDQPTDSPSNTPQPSNTCTSDDSVENDKGSVKPGTGTTSPQDTNVQQPKEAPPELDDFGLPIRSRLTPDQFPSDAPAEDTRAEPEDAAATPEAEQQPEKDVEDIRAPLQNSEKLEKMDNGNIEKVPEQASLPDRKLEFQDSEPEPPSTENPSAPSDPPPPYKKSTTRSQNAEMSEWSHMRLAQAQDTHNESEEEEEHGDWKAMPALGEFDYYDDYGRLIAKGDQAEDNEAVYQGLGGAGRGYTRVQLDEDAQSATSLDEDTSYLFRETGDNQAGLEGEELRDSVSQLQATKDLLNETQKIAYVGVVRLAIHEMNQDVVKIPMTKSKSTKKTIHKAVDGMRKWGQAMMGRLYMHMDISSAEQIMIEQLAEHGVQPGDLIRPLMQNARVKNPMAEDESKTSTSSVSSPTRKIETQSRFSTETNVSEPGSPPPYEVHEGEELPEVRTPSQMPTSDRIDIDLRWTVLCDLFLVLIADSAYDARSRVLLERVGAAMDVTWLQISRFEKRVTDALEMQEQAEKETWDESDHMEKRRKMALKRRYMVMGLATVGGGLVIGLSAGLLAPVIGAGLAAGLTTVGISGTSAFLGGAGGTAMIASTASLSGSVIGMRASKRRTGAVQTFEYRPLHNNKKLNLIVTVSGWMTGKVDDVRLPYSTVDPIMGDIYSVLWEPEMLRSMGDTINILATEVSLP